MPLLVVLSKRASLHRSVADSLLQWCFQTHLIPSRIVPRQHIQPCTCTCLVVPAVCSLGKESPAKTTARPAPKSPAPLCVSAAETSAEIPQALWEKNSPLPSPQASWCPGAEPLHHVSLGDRCHRFCLRLLAFAGWEVILG